MPPYSAKRRLKLVIWSAFFPSTFHLRLFCTGESLVPCALGLMMLSAAITGLPPTRGSSAAYAGTPVLRARAPSANELPDFRTARRPPLRTHGVDMIKDSIVARGCWVWVLRFGRRAVLKSGSSFA